MVVPVLSYVSIARDASTLTLKDATGAYHASTNVGGYGTPNAEIPTIVGFRARYWADTDIYGSLVTSSVGYLTNLFASGHPFTPADFGLTDDAFAAGIQHLKYYPLEEQDTVVTLTEDSKLVTVTAGTAPTTWSTNYKGVMFANGITLGSKVYLIDHAEAITSTTFYLTEEWAGDTVTGYIAYIAPEGDLKILIAKPAENCLVARIGKTGNQCHCNPEEDRLLVDLTMLMFSAQHNFDCGNYQGAHNKVVSIYLECSDCQTTCSCS